MIRPEDRKFLEPLTSVPKEKPFLVYDVESKDGDSQNAGFTRPFLVGMYDGRGKSARLFVNHANVNRLPWQERHFSRGGCIDRFLREVLTSKYAGYNIYAHNGGSFDHLFLLAWLVRHRKEFDFEIVPVQSSIQILRVWKRSEARKAERQKKSKQKIFWTFLDSMKLLPMKLQTAAKTFGLKGKRDMDLWADENDPRWKEYLRDDCIALYEIMQRVHEIVEKLGGEVGVSAPSTSMKLFLRSYLGKGKSPKKLPIFRHWPDCEDAGCPGCFHAWIRSGYYGGRTEIATMRGGGCRTCESSGTDPYLTPDPHCDACHGSGIDPQKFARYFDVNSSYVASLCEGMPAGDRHVVPLDPKTGEPTIDWRMKETHVGFVECDIFVPEDCYLPPFPEKREDGRLVFRTGYLSGVWDVEELSLLFDSAVQGKILKVKKVVWIGKRPVFREMMEALWKLRDKSLPDYDDGMSMMAKLFGNGIYGKFAMKEERTSIVISDVGSGSEKNCVLCGDPAVTGTPLCLGCVGSKPATPIGEEDMESSDCGVWYRKKRVTPAYIIPQIAFHVTSLSRVRLWRYCQEALKLGGQIILVDTDSCITDVDLSSSTRLGEMKEEFPGEPLKVTTVQNKVYMLEKAKPFEGQHESSCTTECKDPSCKGKKDGCVKCHGCANWKVTMKGFPREVRTRDNLLKLMRGEAVEIKRLEKVRTMGRRAFGPSPETGQVVGMVILEKAFRSAYNKRQVLPDGTTKPHFVSEPREQLSPKDDVAALPSAAE